MFFKVEEPFFEYEKDKPILNNINFSLRQGEILAIMGKNGNGVVWKSKTYVNIFSTAKKDYEIATNVMKDMGIYDLKDRSCN